MGTRPRRFGKSLLISTLDEEKSYNENFVEVIKKLSSKGKVVILVDEYDRPMIEYINKNSAFTIMPGYAF